MVNLAFSFFRRFLCDTPKNSKGKNLIIVSIKDFWEELIVAFLEYLYLSNQALYCTIKNLHVFF